MKKSLIRSFIKSAVPEFASDLEIKIHKSSISICVRVKIPALNSGRGYSSTSSVDCFWKVKGSKTCFHNGGLMASVDASLEQLKEVVTVIDFSDYKSHKALRKCLLPKLTENLERCTSENVRSTWTFDNLTHVQSVKARLNEVKAIVGAIFGDPEDVDFESDEYSASFSIGLDFKANIYPKSPTDVSIELEDLQYPPDQGRMSGGYTIMPFLTGCDLKFDSYFQLELKKLIADPPKYLGIDRDCCFADRNSKYHNDPDYDYADCYH